jgi:hypothetical protein
MINQIKAALEKATPGPWSFAVFEDSRHVVYDNTYFNRHIAEIVRGGVENEQREEDNAHLIAQSPTYLRYLLDELEKAQKEIDMVIDQSARELEAANRNWNEKGAENRLIRTEHTTMKEALDWIRSNEGSASVVDVAQNALDSLTNPCTP